MKKLCKDFRDQAIKNINYKKKEMIPLTDEGTDFYENQKVCHICKIELSTDDDNKKYQKVRGHCHYTGKFRIAAHTICNLR